MAKVVGVHGIAQEYRGEDTLKAEWLPAMRDGLRRAKVKEGELPTDEDFKCFFYGDLFREPGLKSTFVPPLSWQDIDNDTWSNEILEALWREAARVDLAVNSPDEVTKGLAWKIGSGLAQRALLELLNGSFFDGWGGEQVLVFGLRQVRMYLHDEDVKSQVISLLHEAIDDDTRVLVGHSLGSIVAYEYLCKNEGHGITTFVTLGSPLATPSVVFERLDPAPDKGIGQWPAVNRWFNIADNRDIVALVKDINPFFWARTKEGVQDRRVVNDVSSGKISHSAADYLTAKETGDAIASGL